MVEPGGPFYGPMGMERFRATALLAVLLASGCAGWSSSSAGQLVRTDGVLVRVGGPAPGAPVALPGVRLHFEGNGGFADVRTGQGGRFAVDLAPGTYRVSITGGGPEANGRPLAPAPHVVHIPHAGRLRLVVSIR
jgi:hypothetical protein